MLQPSGLGASRAAGTACEHVDDLFELLLLRSRELSLIDSERKITEEARHAFKGDLRRVEIDHQALRISPRGEGCLECRRLAAFGSSPVVHEEDALAEYAEQWSAERRREDKAEFIPRTMRAHLLDPCVKRAVLTVRRRPAMQGRVYIKHEAAVVPREEAVARLPSEGGGAFPHVKDVDILGLQRLKEAHERLCVLRGDGAPEVCERRDAPRLEDHRARERGRLPFVVTLEGDLDLLLSGLNGFETLCEDDRRPADEARLRRLLVNRRYAHIAVYEALRLPELDRSACDRLRDRFRIDIHRLRRFKLLLDHIGRRVSVLQKQIRRVLDAVGATAPRQHLACEFALFELVDHLKAEGLASSVRFYM